MPARSADAAPVAIEAQRLVSAVADIFKAVGIAAGDAQVVAGDLVAADLEGIASHGVMLLPMYVERIVKGSVSARSGGEVVSDRGGAIVIDAGHALGQLTARQAVGLVVARAREIGIAVAVVRDGFHFGTAGRFARMIAEHNCIGIVLSSTRPLMPAPGGAEAMVGNNPIAVALPSTGEFPVEADMALSATAMGKIRLAAAAGQRIPEDWAIDAEGRPTTDPAAAIKGMLLPAAGPKGFGLAFVIDLLCGGLSDGAIGAEVRPLYGDQGHAVAGGGAERVRPCLRHRSPVRRPVRWRDRRRRPPALRRSGGTLSLRAFLSGDRRRSLPGRRPLRATRP